MLKGWHILIFGSAIFYLSGCVSTRISKTQKIERVISTARSYKGTPYQMGGMSHSGIDCSGLLYRSFEAIGVNLPRTAAAQSKIGKRVFIDELKPGDLVFFSAKKGKRKITHAGIVTERHGTDLIRVIHSSSSKGVMEVNLLNDYYRSIFVKARRPAY